MLKFICLNDPRLGVDIWGCTVVTEPTKLESKEDINPLVEYELVYVT